ncbi:zinc ribbon domain-containing protein [Candidatus Bathyarchaeota archaeon]|nr:MAG: zinc ribbon domain-containing protein [Candidatus Bathyarchaeota archaeon]
MNHCPQCGDETSESAKYCPKCGYSLQEPVIDYESRTKYSENLSYAFTLLVSTPVIFIPEIAAAFLNYTMNWSIQFIGGFFDIESFAHLVDNPVSKVSYVQDYSEYPPEFWVFGVTIIVLLFLYSLISGFFSFTAVHMIYSKYKDDDVSLVDSFRYCFKNFGRIFTALFIGTLFSLTVILIPAVVLMYVIMVVDGVGIRDGLSRGFSLSLKRLGVSILIVVIYLGLQYAFGYVPWVGDLLYAVPSTIITASLIDLYINSKPNIQYN